MKKILIVAAALVAGVASAQSDISSGLSVRGGVLFPTTSDLSGTFWGIGVDYDLQKSFLPNSTTFLAIDLMTKNLKLNSYALPITLNQRWKLSQSTGETTGLSTYGFLGAGLAIVNMAPSSTVFAARGGLGADLSPNVFAEISMTLTSKTKGSNIQASHFGLWLGYKF